MTQPREIALRVNGVQRSGLAEPRMTLADSLRDVLGLTGQIGKHAAATRKAGRR